MLQARLGEDRKIAVQRGRMPAACDDGAGRAAIPAASSTSACMTRPSCACACTSRVSPGLRGRGPGGPAGLFGLQYILLFLVLIAMLAWLVARMATRPIRQLAQAASRLGSDIDHAPLPERADRDPPGSPPSMPCRRASAARSSIAPTCWRPSRMTCRHR
jgi:hypothetical protein